MMFQNKLEQETTAGECSCLTGQTSIPFIDLQIQTLAVSMYTYANTVVISLDFFCLFLFYPDCRVKAEEKKT
jgi:hypothetical protein